MNMALPREFMPLLIAVSVMTVLLILRGILFRIAHRWAEKSPTKFDDILIASLKTPSLFWSVALGLYFGLSLSELPEKYIRPLETTIYVILIISVTIAASNLSGKILRNCLFQTDLPLPTTGLAYGVMKGVIIATGILICLSVLGLSIAPLLTALGVGGLAVALALQDTLANLFAGMHILLEKSVRIGDFVKLENGQEGYVQDITWRTTRIRMLPNNMVVIPNSKLAQSVVTNYCLPEKQMLLFVSVGVSYDSDIDFVETILVEEALRAASEVPGLLADPPPYARFSPGFSASSLDFTIVCQVAEFVDQYLAQHTIRKMVFKRFKQEGIEIPFPQRTVHLRKEPERPVSGIVTGTNL
jgi:small-conductance mechanosensitive channel